MALRPLPSLVGSYLKAINWELPPPVPTLNTHLLGRCISVYPRYVSTALCLMELTMVGIYVGKVRENNMRKNSYST